MDQEIRNKLRNVVTQCRKLLEDSVLQELEGKYGIFAKKDQVTADPNATMAHLTEEEQTARKDILDHFGHIKARGFKPKEALDQLVREIAFTHLNRLCAYKMMEAREVYVGGQKFREAVSRGINSNGVKFYLADHPEEERLFNTGHQDVAYRRFLDWLGGLLSDEIGVLFNPNDPANRLYPRQKTLDEVLNLLNGGGIKPDETELREAWPKIWSQDETIGWVYQYFTPKELRDQARKESSAPRNSYELAFRNQFFTPRYVVEFLTDNTLGRIWYEMRKGDTKLREQCRYMVRRPIEMFLKAGEQPPKGATEGQGDLSQEELLNLPVHIPHRPKKNPRELKVLDPACGSGHFLLYCFDLLQTIYEEAYTDPDLGPSLKTEYPTLEDLRRDTPRLILACNLHGIDIDLRASQIAALALWLRCQRAYRDIGLKKDHPKITRSNFVCAEPMPGEAQMLKEFVGQLEPKLLGQIVEVVFEKMKLAGVAGSLLKIEEEIRDAVALAKKQWAQETIRATDRKGQPLLFSVATMERLVGKPEQAGLFDLGDITDDQFFEQAEARVIEALRLYAEKSQNGHRLQRRLFSDDALSGFAFVDVCHKRFDVVLMNPPFGEAATVTDGYLRASYPLGYIDLYTAFLDRGSGIRAKGGLVGAITSRTALTLSSFANWRKTRLLGETRINVCADLGYGVLDTAMVEVAAYTLGEGANCAKIVFIDLDRVSDKSGELLTSVTGESDRLYLVSTTDLLSLPNATMAYFLEPSLRADFAELPAVSSFAEVLGGNATSDDMRFIRCFWEIQPDSLRPGPNRAWRWISKGGEYSLFYLSIHLVVDWRGDGGYLGDYMYSDRPRNGYLWGPKSWSAAYMGIPGVVWSLRSQKGVSFRALPADCAMSGKSAIVTTRDRQSDLALLGILNTERIARLARCLATFGSYEKGAIANLPVDRENGAAIGACAELGFRAAVRANSYLESDPHFSTLFRHQARTLKELLNAIRSDIKSQASVVSDALAATNREYRPGVLPVQGWRVECVSDLANAVSLSDVLSELMGCAFGRWDVRIRTGERPVPELPSPFSHLPHCPPGMLQSDECLPLTHPPEGYPLRGDWDGILTDDPENQSDIVRTLRDVLEIIWKNRAEPIEKEASEILGVRELRDYFRKPSKGGFWFDHISRYSKSNRKAPIYWLLQSTKKNYALWLYYHRLDKDLLFKALVNYVEPKIRLETSRLETFRSQKTAAGESSKEGKRLANEIDRQEDFLSELRDFEDKLRRAAKLHLEPDINDGVVLNIAPLHELVPWKEAKNYWDELLAGKYEWSSIGKQLRQKGLVK